MLRSNREHHSSVQLTSGVPSGYTASLRCTLTSSVPTSRLRGICRGAFGVRAVIFPRQVRKDPCWQHRAAPPQSLPPQRIPVSGACPSRASPSRSRYQICSPCRPSRSTGCWATRGGRPASAKPGQPGTPTCPSSLASRRSSRRSARSKTSPAPCRSRSVITGSSRPSTPPRSARTRT